MKKALKFLVLGLGLCFCACEKNPEGGKTDAKAVRMEISLERYHNDAGAMGARLWSKSDKVAIVNTATQGEPVTASPITPDSQASLFTFSLTGAGDGDKLFAWMPNYAAIDYAEGKITANIPTKQTGKISPIYVGKAKYSDSASSITKMQMSTYYSVLYGVVAKGNYFIKKAILTGNANEKIAGEVTIDYETLSTTASATSVTVEFGEALDCRNGQVKVPFMISPVTFSNGYTIKFITDSGVEMEFSTDEKTECTMGGKVESGAFENGATQLLFCGDNMIYLIDADLAASTGYKNAILWEWDAKSEKETVGKGMIRLDDCKPVDNNTKILATSSQSYAVLLDYKTKKLLWYSNVSGNAHSAEMLPNDRIAVACSDGSDCIQIFDVKTSNKVLFTTPLASAHGVVWNKKTERLYAIGGTSLNIYKLTDWETTSPKLTLEKTINTKSFVTGLHDMTFVDENTLLVGGNKAAFFNIQQETFTRLPYFNSSTALKSINYNPENGACWYTDATNSGRDPSWTMDDIRFTSNVNSLAPTDKKWEKSIMIGAPFIMYKVRIFSW